MYFDPQVVGDRPSEIDSAFGAKKGDITMNAYPKFVGDFPLQGVCTFLHLLYRWLPDIRLTRLCIHTQLGRPRQTLSVSFKATDSKLPVNIWVNTSNGSYYEAVRLEKIEHEHWVWAARFGKFIGSSKQADSILDFS